MRSSDYKIKQIAEHYLRLCNELNDKKTEGRAQLEMGAIMLKEVK